MARLLIISPSLLDHPGVKVQSVIGTFVMSSIISGICTFFDHPQIWGYSASSLVLATFCMKRMVPLRMIAICSNFAFIAYGTILHLTPIVILHSVLVPINVLRLSQHCNLGFDFWSAIGRCSARSFVHAEASQESNLAAGPNTTYTECRRSISATQHRWQAGVVPK